MESKLVLLRYSYFPLMFVGFNAAAIFAVETQESAGWLALLMGAALTTSFIIETLIPYNQQWNRSFGDIPRDALHFIINESSNFGGLLLLPWLSGLVLWPTVWPQHWPFWIQVVFAVVLFDISSTLFHRMSHKRPFFWRFHAVHHAPIRLYGLNGIMKHPVFQLLDALVSLGPLLLIGIPQNVALVLVFSVFIQLLIQHSNADMRTGPLRRIFASAEVHRFHHLKGAAGDINFALFFSVWDVLLGTAFYDTRKSTLTSDDIGIDGLSNYPVDYWGQLKAPFLPAAVLTPFVTRKVDEIR